jgi:CBS domain-containing protein
VITVSEHTEFGEIARVLVAHQIKRVPVVRDGRVTGIVARDDVLRALAASRAEL